MSIMMFIESKFLHILYSPFTFKHPTLFYFYIIERDVTATNVKVRLRQREKIYKVTENSCSIQHLPLQFLNIHRKKLTVSFTENCRCEHVIISLRVFIL